MAYEYYSMVEEGFLFIKPNPTAMCPCPSDPHLRPFHSWLSQFSPCAVSEANQLLDGLCVWLFVSWHIWDFSTMQSTIRKKHLDYDYDHDSQWQSLETASCSPATVGSSLSFLLSSLLPPSSGLPNLLWNLPGSCSPGQNVAFLSGEMKWPVDCAWNRKYVKKSAACTVYHILRIICYTLTRQAQGFNFIEFFNWVWSGWPIALGILLQFW